MRTLFDYLKRNAHWLLFILLQTLGLTLLYRYNTYQNSAIFTSANALTGQLLKWEAAVWSYVTLGEQNKQLTQRNILLEQRAAQLNEALRRATHDSTYTEKRQAQILKDYKIIHADVINNTIKKRNNYLTIDKGIADGVAPEMGVVCGTGVVGIVYATSIHYAIVMPILNNHSNISCRLRGTNHFGYLRWDGTTPRQATLEDIPRHAIIKKGMPVETSGFSAVFPAGLWVGNVALVENSDDGLSYKLQVNLGTDFSKLTNVLVMTNPHRNEIDSLQAIIKD